MDKIDNVLQGNEDTMFNRVLTALTSSGISSKSIIEFEEEYNTSEDTYETCVKHLLMTGFYW
jgi:hypothetical protein